MEETPVNPQQLPQCCINQSAAARGGHSNAGSIREHPWGKSLLKCIKWGCRAPDSRTSQHTQLGGLRHPRGGKGMGLAATSYLSLVSDEARWVCPLLPGSPSISSCTPASYYAPQHLTTHPITSVHSHNHIGWEGRTG